MKKFIENLKFIFLIIPKCFKDLYNMFYLREIDRLTKVIDKEIKRSKRM